MQINSYSFYPIDSRMYVIMEGDEAFVVDPCESNEALKFLQEQKINKIHVFLTHEHYDHISGVNWLREHFEQVTVYCLDNCGKGIKNPSKNLSLFYKVLFVGKNEKVRDYVDKMEVPSYFCESDVTFEGKFEWNWKGHSIRCVATPGHSVGSMCIFFDDNILFSGDTLVTGNDTITRLPGGSKKDFNEITLPILRGINAECMVYPGHGDAQKLARYPAIKK